MEQIKGELNSNTLVKREHTPYAIRKTYWLSEAQQEVVVDEYAVPNGEDVDFEMEVVSINGKTA